MAISNINKRLLDDKKFNANLMGRELDLPEDKEYKELSADVQKAIDRDKELFFKELKARIKRKNKK